MSGGAGRPTGGGPEDGSRPHLIVGARVSHDRAPIAALERASHEDREARLRELVAQDGISEAVVLQTCNRVEEYVVAESAAAGRTALEPLVEPLPEAAVATMDHGESLRHLLRVAAGLESQVLGEDQILGQVRDGYLAAQQAGTLGPVLEDAMLKAIHVGERARTETAINEGIVSLGSAAVDLAARRRGLEGRVLVVGAGEVAETVVSALEQAGAADVEVRNRSAERAAELARPVDAAWGDLDDLAGALAAADVVIVSTGSSTPVIGRASLATAGETLVIDLGQPRDVAPEARELPDVDAYDLDDLRAVTRRTHEERADAAVAVEAIVEEEYERLVEGYKRKRADAVIRGMYRGAEEIKEREVARALARLDDPDPEEREVIQGLADAVVSRLLAIPTESLRDAAANDDLETLLAAIELFDPGVDADRTRDLLAELPAAVGEAQGDARPVQQGSED